MKSITKILIVGCFLAFGAAVYAGSSIGWGVSALKDHKTMSQIEQDCPNYYTSRDGQCLRTSFRSIYFLRTGYSGFSGK